jgi:NitT/TauT family transport system substrate-binding protein
MRPFSAGARMELRRYAALLAVLAFALAGAARAQPVARVVFGTNWFAEAEHGGFYQAQAEGLYRKQGLDVEVRMGGPQINGLQLLLAGQLDMFMGYDLQVLAAREQGLPLVTVAASLQKDPAVILAHADVHRIEDLKGHPIYISAASNTTFWPWLRATFGFSDDQKRPYSFSVQPFIVDKASATQGYVTSEPYSAMKAGVKPAIFLLADLGYPPYAQTVVVTEAYLKKNADLIRRFITASAEGYRSYLRDPRPGNALIKKSNPQMEDGLLSFGLDKMREYQLVSGGDAGRLGIMTMTDARWKRTFDFMVGANLLKPTTNYRAAYTLDLVKDVHIK